MKIRFPLALVRPALTLALAAAGVSLIPSCASTKEAGGGQDSYVLPSAEDGATYAPAPAAAPGFSPARASQRPGLATAAGGERWSATRDVTFYRKATGYPDASDLFHYNDEAGAKAMAAVIGESREMSGPFDAAGDRLRVTVASWGRVLPRLEATGRRIVIGQPGTAYTVRLENRTAHALEVVMSVDGLDVKDGKAASARKRGYVINPKDSITVDGFRKDSSTVRTFIFGGVGESLAAKSGAAGNVGVIGLAVYEEDEAKAQAVRMAEARRREDASAFPGAR